MPDCDDEVVTMNCKLPELSVRLRSHRPHIVHRPAHACTTRPLLPCRNVRNVRRMTRRMRRKRTRREVGGGGRWEVKGAVSSRRCPAATTPSPPSSSKWPSAMIAATPRSPTASAPHPTRVTWWTANPSQAAPPRSTR